MDKKCYTCDEVVIRYVFDKAGNCLVDESKTFCKATGKHTLLGNDTCKLYREKREEKKEEDNA